MMSKLKLAFVPVVCLPFAGCAGTPTPIVAVAADHLGVVASADPQTQGAALAVGYRGAKFAILPVEGANGKLLALKTPSGQESYSIFTQLGAEAKGGTGGGVAVEQVLAVGPAADNWVKKASPFPMPVPTPPAQQ